ncbi:MFS transporter [Granulicella cerasi]|uniref:MFS transporter n=1 Tax=Granulicella cerasi TaxID=741063 RepID=A0ABW1Z9P7_9BACT|nr:MFS transporter [Granulicella cerasi]
MKNPFAATFRALKSYNFRLWLMGSLVSNIGTWMQRVAQDWLVLVQLTHHDARAVGIVMAMQFAPQLLLLPWSGMAADRFNQRKLLMLTQATMGFFALVLGTLTLTGHVRLWEVYLLALLSGSAAALDAPARQAFVGELVGDEHLSNAVALNSTAFNAAMMIGPAVAGLLIAKVGTGWAFLLNGFSFIAVLISLALLRVREMRNHERAKREPGRLLEGFRYVWQRPDQRAMVIMLALIGTFGLNFPIYISTMAVNVFHVEARGFGMLSSALAVGTLTGALLAASRSAPKFGALFIGALFFGVGCTAGAFAPGYWTFALALAVTGAAALTFTNSTNSLMQLSTPPAMRGRVLAIRVGVALGGTPIGAPIAGWVAHHAGPRWSLGIGALSAYIAAVVALVAIKRGHGEAAT